MNEKKLDLVVGAICMVSIFGFFFTLSLIPFGCATFKTIGDDAAVCARADIAGTVAMATTQFVTSAALGSSNADSYLSLGASIAAKYGAEVAWCTIQKVWSDLGGANLTSGHLQPSKELIAADYLKNHKALWLK